MFVKNGGIILEHHKVEQIQPGDIVKVLTSRGLLSAPKVVITAGVCACVCVCARACVCVRKFQDCCLFAIV